MNVRAFFDTNVLLYADDADALAKTAVARALISGALHEMSGVLSAQVLSEYFVIATKKLGVEPAVAAQKIALLAKLEVLPVTLALVQEAVDLVRLEPLSYRDALIVRAAQHANCRVLYSEDMQHGRRFGSVEVRNPFR